jgi:hypothetical protein
LPTTARNRVEDTALAVIIESVDETTTDVIHYESILHYEALPLDAVAELFDQKSIVGSPDDTSKALDMAFSNVGPGASVNKGGGWKTIVAKGVHLAYEQVRDYVTENFLTPPQRKVYQKYFKGKWWNGLGAHAPSPKFYNFQNMTDMQVYKCHLLAIIRDVPEFSPLNRKIEAECKTIEDFDCFLQAMVEDTSRAAFKEKAANLARQQLQRKRIDTIEKAMRSQKPFDYVAM